MHACYAKLLFSANKVPEALDDTDAFFRRWIIVTFPNVFNGENCDPYKLEKLVTDQELSGLLNMALMALKRLLKTGHFSNTQTTDEIREDYIRKSSPIASFMMDCLEVDSDAFIEKRVLYNVFATYCRDKSIPCVTQDTFFKNLPQHVAVIDFRPKIEEKRYHMVKGVRYGDAVSTLSNVSRVFYILVVRGNDFKSPWKAVKLEDLSYIKMEIPLDRVDTVDIEHKITSSKFRLDEVVGCVHMELSSIGECDRCGEKPTTLTHAIKTFFNSFQVCEDCAVLVKKNLRKETEP
jgi:hypothetical protein